MHTAKTITKTTTILFLSLYVSHTLFVQMFKQEKSSFLSQDKHFTDLNEQQTLVSYKFVHELRSRGNLLLSNCQTKMQQIFGYIVEIY